jgi:hypothetical protein
VNEIFLALSTISGKAKDSIMVTTRAQKYPDLDTNNSFKLNDVPVFFEFDLLTDSGDVARRSIADVEDGESDIAEWDEGPRTVLQATSRIPFSIGDLDFETLSSEIPVWDLRGDDLTQPQLKARKLAFQKHDTVG